MSTVFLISYGILWILVLVLLGLMFLVFRQFGLVYLKTAGGVSRSGVEIGTTIQDLHLTTVTGTQIRLSDYGGQPVLIVFTSPHCAPCRKLVPHLQDFIEKYIGLQTIIFSIDARIEETVDLFPAIRCPIISLPDRELYQSVFMGEVTPFAFLLDGDRKVVAKGLANDLTNLEFILHSTSNKMKSLINIFNETTSNKHEPTSTQTY